MKPEKAMFPCRLGVGSWFAHDVRLAARTDLYVDRARTTVRQAPGGYVVKAR